MGRLSTPVTIDAPTWSPPIVVAARKRHTHDFERRDLAAADAILDFLVDCGVRLDVPRILVALCRSGRADLVRRALHAGADPHHVTRDHDTPIQAAVSGDHPEIIELLLDVGVDPDQGMFIHGRVPIHGVRSLETFELLLRHGASVDARSQHAGESALFVVASRSDLDVAGQLAIIERLEALGQSLQDANRHGRRAIEWLEARQDSQIREFLAVRASEGPGSDR